MTFELLFYSVSLFIPLFILGTILCLYLYKWNFAKYFHSQLWIKTAMWVPIFLALLIVLYLKNWVAIPLTALLMLLAMREFSQLKRRDTWTLLYVSCICVFLICICLPFWIFDDRTATYLLLIVGMSSVLSDVFAYFFGNFFGKHKLPAFVNKQKSWEGVAGQIIGAIAGFLVLTPGLPDMPHLSLAIFIGLASACGDIANSIIKRRSGIKDWGTVIPGHGGVLDRFASLGVALAIACLWVIVTRWSA